MEEEDYFVDDSYTYWTETMEAGADRHETKEYESMPMTTIYGPNEKPYLSIIDGDPVMMIQMHNYDNTLGHPIYFTFDKRALSDLIKALEKYEGY